jgi:hypothetical protein
MYGLARSSPGRDVLRVRVYVTTLHEIRILTHLKLSSKVFYTHMTAREEGGEGSTRPGPYRRQGRK